MRKYQKKYIAICQYNFFLYDFYLLNIITPGFQLTNHRDILVLSAKFYIYTLDLMGWVIILFTKGLSSICTNEIFFGKL